MSRKIIPGCRYIIIGSAGIYEFVEQDEMLSTLEFSGWSWNAERRLYLQYQDRDIVYRAKRKHYEAVPGIRERVMELETALAIYAAPTSWHGARMVHPFDAVPYGVAQDVLLEIEKARQAG